MSWIDEIKAIAKCRTVIVNASIAGAKIEANGELVLVDSTMQNVELLVTSNAQQSLPCHQELV